LKAEQKPSRAVFVLHAHRDREAVRRALGEMGAVEELQGSDLLLLRLNKEPASAKSGWDRIRKKLGKGESVQPVLVDDRGLSQYPTGEISVRFRKPPSDAGLKRFARTHGLRLGRRNEFMPQQAIFELAEDGGSYIPKVVKDVSGDESVELAWANTLARYERV
jgi:hypothetical protein